MCNSVLSFLQVAYLIKITFSYGFNFKKCNLAMMCLT